jgi:prepilin-type N-terminal cleavage/methylation domain-containing protein
MSNHASVVPERSGFTLVELLVVITIIAVLASTDYAGSVSGKACQRQNAAIKAEIDMLHMAMMNYKNEYGSFPPCTGLAAARSHVQRLFPRVASINAEVPATSVPTPQTALHDWLQGYSKNPTSPRSSTPLVKLFEFDQNRMNANQYYPADKKGSPYIYIDASNYGNGFGDVPGFNTDTFQILCAGLDEVLHEDRNGNGVLDFGEDFNGNEVLDKSDDDLSNFWKGTRGDQ